MSIQKSVIFSLSVRLSQSVKGCTDRCGQIDRVPVTKTIYCLAKHQARSKIYLSPRPGPKTSRGCKETKTHSLLRGSQSMCFVCLCVCVRLCVWCGHIHDTVCVTQVTMPGVVVCCILHCGSRETSAVSVTMQTNAAPTNCSVLGSFLPMEADFFFLLF